MGLDEKFDMKSSGHRGPEQLETMLPAVNKG